MAGNALTAGLSLRIPDVSRATNSASTYRTYQPSEIIGSTTPQGIDPGPPPPPKAECGAAQIIMIVVAIVVTIYTAGATANLLAGVGLQGGVMVGSATVGVNAAGAVIAGAVGGAAGSIASQAVGIAAGAQDSFSWKAVGLAAVGGAVGGAINANAGAFKSFESAAGVARAVTSNVLTQGIGVMTGLQEKFSWQSVAISGAAAAISPSIQKGFSESAFAKDFLGGADSLATKTAANFLTGTTTQIIRMAVYGQGKLDFASLAADAFGNAIGEAVAEQMKPKVTSPTAAANAAAKPASVKTFGDQALVEAIDYAPLEKLKPLDLSIEPLDALESNARTVTIKRGDTLTKLAGTNDPETLDKIAQYNGLRSRHEIRAGQTLEIPDAETLAGVSTSDAVAARGAAGAKYYALRQASLAASSDSYGMCLAPSSSRNGAEYDLARASARTSSIGLVGYIGGAAEILLGGTFNQTIRIGGGLASIPYLLDSAEAAVAIQDAARENLGYKYRTSGAAAISAQLAPVGAFLQHNVGSPLRGFSERYLGDGLTTLAGAGLQFGVESFSTVTGLRGAASFGTAALDNAFTGPVAGSMAAQRGGVNFGAILREVEGPPPAGMVDPHAHHILFKEGKGAAQKALVLEGQTILRGVGIDPIMGTENLAWAPNRVAGQHHIDALRNVVEELRAVRDFGGGKAEMTQKLKELGELAARRK